MGQKNLKGTVSISNVDNRIRLRWRYQGKRYSVNLAAHTKLHLTKAKTVAALIEKDMAFETFDYSLNRYKGNQGSANGLIKPEKTIVAYFEEWASVYKQMDCETHIDYYSLRNTIKKWGKFTEQNILTNLNAEKFSPQTYNKRLSLLKGFAKWLVKQKVWATNPLEEVDNRKVKKVDDPKRRPFTEEEIGKILNAFKNDTFSIKSAHFPHSHYYPFLYFIFKTGVRNGEAVGLRVNHIDFANKFITIKEVMARNAKGGTNASQRIRKETKNGKKRLLPLTKDLEELLFPLCANKGSGDLVFQSFNGLCIDDRMFQRRVFKPVLKKLKIEERVLYACRHTFGSRCIDSGITPVMTAFLMGNNPETALRNYTHQLNIPKERCTVFTL
jgi:integrase